MDVLCHSDVETQRFRVAVRQGGTHPWSFGSFGLNSGDQDSKQVINWTGLNQLLLSVNTGFVQLRPNLRTACSCISICRCACWWDGCGADSQLSSHTCMAALVIKLSVLCWNSPMIVLAVLCDLNMWYIIQCHPRKLHHILHQIGISDGSVKKQPSTWSTSVAHETGNRGLLSEVNTY